MIIVTSARHLQ